jgi:hypothetical protein
MKIEARLLARSLGFPEEQVRFSNKLEWADHGGRLQLTKAVADPRTKQITIFTDAIEVRHPKNAKAQGLAVLHKCIKALTRHTPGGHEHDQESHGNWSDGPGGVDFISPSVADHMDFPQAVDALRGKPQSILKEASSYIDKELKLAGLTKDVVGAWSDGAENSVANFHGGTKWTDWSKLVTAASMKGHLADQKSVLVFQEKPIRKPRESVHIEGDGGSKWLGVLNLDVEVNPTRNEIRDLAEEGPVRVTADADGNLYAWNARKAIHDQIVGAMDLDERSLKYRDIWRLHQGRLASDRFLEGVQDAKPAYQEVRDKLASLEGNGALMSFEAKGSLEDIHKNLLADGLAFHSLVPRTGGATVYAAVVNKDDVKATVAAAKQAAERYGSKITFRPGRGEFIGDTLGTGSDREQRDRARSVYEGNIRRSDVHGSQALWESVRDRWGKALDQKQSPLTGGVNEPGGPQVIHRASLPHAKTPEPKFIRFGRIPKSGKSTVGAAPSALWSMMAEVSGEPGVGDELGGVSVFKVEYNAERNLWEIDDSELGESGIASADALIFKT